MNHLQWPLDGGGYLTIEWPERPKISQLDYRFIVDLFGLILRKFKRHTKPDGIFMKVGSIELNCRLRR